MMLLVQRISQAPSVAAKARLEFCQTTLCARTVVLWCQDGFLQPEMAAKSDQLWWCVHQLSFEDLSEFASRDTAAWISEVRRMKHRELHQQAKHDLLHLLAGWSPTGKLNQ